MFQKTTIFIIILTALSATLGGKAQSSSTTIKGVVTDAQTRIPIAGIEVRVKNINVRTDTGDNGQYSLTVIGAADSVTFSLIGYQSQTLAIVRSKVNTINVALESEALKIDAATVVGKRVKYRKKGNPAVELVRQLIAQRSKVDPEKVYENFGYERYEKFVLSLHDFNKNPKNNRLTVLTQFRDTTDVTGLPSLPLSIKERILATSFRGRSKTETVVAQRSEGVDERYRQDGTNTFLNVMIDEVDIFDDNIFFLMQNFVSPLASNATFTYKYFLRPDTISYQGVPCIELSFTPYDHQSLGFNGKMTVTADSTLFIRRVELNFPKSMNLNFAYNLILNLDFEAGPRGEQLLIRDDVYYQFMLNSSNDESGFDVRRINTFRDFEYDTIPPVPVVVLDSDAKYWAQNRHYPLRSQEYRIDTLAQTLRKIPVYRLIEGLGVLMSDQFVGFGKDRKVEFGPVLSVYSNNALEGSRLFFGGVTTPKFSSHLFLEGSAAYGFKDDKYKWHGAVEYSFIEKKEFLRQFPIHSIRAEVNYDTYQFGRDIGEASLENAISSIRRGQDSTLTYLRNYQLIYTQESSSHFSFTATARNYTQYQTPLMVFAPDNAFPEFTMAELKLRLRYAPGEKLMQSRKERKSIKNFKPVFEIAHTSGFKSVLGGDFDRNLTEFTFTNRFNVNPVGYVDFKLKAAAEWNQVPYLLLSSVRADQSFFLRKDAFALRRPLEFITDQSLEWNVSWYWNGFLLNKLPLIKKLKWREIVSTKGMWGSLSKQNNPSMNPDQIPLPGASKVLGSQPYVELSFGVENIFRFFRVDYVQRMTYRDNHSGKNSALLFSFQVQF